MFSQTGSDPEQPLGKVGRVDEALNEATNILNQTPKTGGQTELVLINNGPLPDQVPSKVSEFARVGANVIVVDVKQHSSLQQLMSMTTDVVRFDPEKTDTAVGALVDMLKKGNVLNARFYSDSCSYLVK